MKDVSADYIAAEEADQRKPVELYKIWRMDEAVFWYYTSGDVSVTFDGQTYTPATLKRSQSKYDSQLEVTTMDITAGYLNDPATDFLSVNPVDILWIQVMKLHREQDPLEADVVFIGQIKDVNFKGVQANIKCVGFEHFLKKTIPGWRYQINCNHQVFNANCGLTAAIYKTTETISLDATGTILTGTAFGLEDDGYFIGGEVKFGVESRTIVAHSGTTITIMYKMTELEDSDEVDAYPGCDGRPETCRDKYDNITHFLGFPFIPIENPATRVTW
jgi:uncharacterized phage protein (TIGR02218 family)